MSLMFATVACSTQNRDASPLISDTELFSLIQEFPTSNALSVMTFDGASQGSGTLLFHTRQASGKPAPSVLSVLDLGLFIPGLDGLNSYQAGLDQVDAVFVDQVDAQSGQRVFALLLKMTTVGDTAPDYFSATSAPGDFKFTDSEFSTVLTSDSGVSLEVVSNDLSLKYTDELASSVKLNIYTTGSNGVSGYVGQISTMAGFGNR
ncbi:MAG: hypothetical protein ABL927_00440 [Bdellovibrionales bacterium]